MNNEKPSSQIKNMDFYDVDKACPDRILFLLFLQKNSFMALKLFLTVVTNFSNITFKGSFDWKTL